jgi:hypothetical protein
MIWRDVNKTDAGRRPDLPQFHGLYLSLGLPILGRTDIAVFFAG